MEHPASKSVLLAFVTTTEDGSNKINIYGTPTGLRRLAAELMKQADVDQSSMTHLGDHDTDHSHLSPSQRQGILAVSSDELQIGRLDLRNGDLAYWARGRIDQATDPQ